MCSQLVANSPGNESEHLAARISRGLGRAAGKLMVANGKGAKSKSYIPSTEADLPGKNASEADSE